MALPFARATPAKKRIIAGILNELNCELTREKKCLREKTSQNGKK